MENKKSFILHSDLLESVDFLSNEDLGIFFRAILHLQNKKEYSIPPHLRLGFEMLKVQFDRNEAKYSEVLGKRKLAGINSGKARKLKSEQEATNRTSVKSVEQKEQEATNRTSVKSVEQKEQEATNRTDSDNVSVNVSDSVNVNKEPNLFNTPSSNIKTPLTPQGENGVFKEKEGKNNIIGSVDALMSMIGDKGRQQAKDSAKGWDIDALASIYLGGMETRGMPKNLSSAFAGWCKSYTKNKTL
jgi:hypothetical protein